MKLEVGAKVRGLENERKSGQVMGHWDAVLICTLFGFEHS